MILAFDAIKLCMQLLPTFHFNSSENATPQKTHSEICSFVTATTVLQFSDKPIRRANSLIRRVTERRVNESPKSHQIHSDDGQLVALPSSVIVRKSAVLYKIHTEKGQYQTV